MRFGAARTCPTFARCTHRFQFRTQAVQSLEVIGRRVAAILCQPVPAAKKSRRLLNNFCTLREIPGLSVKEPAEHGPYLQQTRTARATGSEFAAPRRSLSP
jgi:hypothetical protein